MWWLHSLCKNIDLERDSRNRPRIYDLGMGSKQYSQGNYSWLRSGFFMRQENAPVKSPSTSSVTLIIFSASSRLQGVFAGLADHHAWQDVLEDPFSLFSIVLEDLSLEVEGSVYKVLDVLRYIEGVCHHSSSKSTRKLAM